MPGLLRGVARTAVVAGTAAGVGGRVHHRQEKRWAKKDGEQQDTDTQPEQATETTDPGVTDEQLQQLEKLGKLKDKGILTQTEFDTKKQQILGL